MVYKHAVVAALHIYAQRGEDAAKRGGLNSHGNYIVDHGKSRKCVSVFMGTLTYLYLPTLSTLWVVYVV